MMSSSDDDPVANVACAAARILFTNSCPSDVNVSWTGFDSGFEPDRGMDSGFDPDRGRDSGLEPDRGRDSGLELVKILSSGLDPDKSVSLGMNEGAGATKEGF